jgi:hypothetical protein
MGVDEGPLKKGESQSDDFSENRFAENYCCEGRHQLGGYWRWDQASSKSRPQLEHHGMSQHRMYCRAHRTIQCPLPRHVNRECIIINIAR